MILYSQRSETGYTRDHKVCIISIATAKKGIKHGFCIDYLLPISCNTFFVHQLSICLILPWFSSFSPSVAL